MDPDAECHEVKAKETKKAEKKEEPKQEQKNLKATPKQIELLKKLVPDESWEGMLKWAGVDKVEDMTAAQASEVITEKTKK